MSLLLLFPWAPAPSEPDPIAAQPVAAGFGLASGPDALLSRAEYQRRFGPARALPRRRSAARRRREEALFILR